MLDELHYIQYQKNNFTINAMQLSRVDNKQKQCGIMANLIGYELPVYLAEQLISIGATDIQFEVPVLDTKADVLATYNKQIHAYECKAVKELERTKILKQIKSYCGCYRHVHVFVLKDTKVSNNIKRIINNEGADIIRAGITRKQLIDRVLSLFAITQ